MHTNQAVGIGEYELNNLSDWPTEGFLCEVMRYLCDYYAPDDELVDQQLLVVLHLLLEFSVENDTFLSLVEDLKLKLVDLYAGCRSESSRLDQKRSKT